MIFWYFCKIFIPRSKGPPLMYPRKVSTHVSQCSPHRLTWAETFWYFYILNKSENATLSAFGQNGRKTLFISISYFFFFCKLKCITSSYHLCCTCVSSKWKPKCEILLWDFILFVRNKIWAIFGLEYMCSKFTFVQDIFCMSYDISTSLFSRVVHSLLHDKFFRLVQIENMSRRENKYDLASWFFFFFFFLS